MFHSNNEKFGFRHIPSLYLIVHLQYVYTVVSELLTHWERNLSTRVQFNAKFLFALTFTYSTHSQSYLGQYLLSLFRGIVSHVSFCLFVSYISNTVRIIITFHILFWNLLIFWMIFFNWCALRFSLVVKFYEFWQIYCHVLAITISHKIVSPF